MNYSELTYNKLIAEINKIRSGNLNALDNNAQLFEATVDILDDTEIEYISAKFDNYRHFFGRAEEFFAEVFHKLNNKDENLEDKPLITMGLVEQMSTFGESAYTQFVDLNSTIDKNHLNSISEIKDTLNKWYEIIGDNLYSLSHIAIIADALNMNFRHIQPFDDVVSNNIAIQSGDVTVTKGDEIYINKKVLVLNGQKKKIMMLLVQAYIATPDIPISWMDIEDEIKTGLDGDLTRDTIVKRVSDLRTTIANQGFGKDVLEIKNANYGEDTGWMMVKKSVE